MAIFFGELQVMIWEGEIYLSSHTEHEPIKLPINVGDTFKLKEAVPHSKNIDDCEFPYFTEDMPVIPKPENVIQ